MTTIKTTISRRTTTLLFFFVASFLFGTTVFVVQVYPHAERFCVLFFFLDHFSQNHHLAVLAALFAFFFSSSVSTPLRFRRVVVYVAFCLSVGVDLGLKKGVSLESSSSVSSFRRKRRIGGKNGFFSMMLGRTPTTSSKLSFRGVRKILTTKMFVSLL